MNTLYWHDYETWGSVPARDKPAQFAGIRTDENLNIVGEPLTLYCRPARDMLPQPEACLVTGITPQRAQHEGVAEYQFMAAVHRELSRPGTCGVGYNSVRFDDEVTRYGLYRNFYDPYEREWKNGNSRWDIIDMVRLTRALRPEGIEWPTRDDGKPSFKLEHLTAANGLSHESAHDALSDVYATIKLAKLIKSRQPALFDYLYRMRTKQSVGKMIDLKTRKPLLHISSMFAAENGCAALVIPLVMHPVNKNAVIAYNLSEDPRPLLELPAEKIRERMFTAQSELPEGLGRIPLKLVHLNKCPVLVTARLLDAAAAQRLNIDRSRCERHWQLLVGAGDRLQPKLQDIFRESGFAPATDPEQMLYAGFLNDEDRLTQADVRQASVQALRNHTFSFHDKRLPELLFRYRARNFPESLSEAELQQWSEFCYQRLTDPEAGASITLDAYGEKIAELRQQPDLNIEHLRILDALEEYGEELICI